MGSCPDWGLQEMRRCWSKGQVSVVYVSEFWGSKASTVVSMADVTALHT